MAGINVMVADTDEEAQRQMTTVEQMFIDMVQGKRRLMQPPVDPATLTNHAGPRDSMLKIKAVGSPQTAKAQLQEFVDRTGADELITVTYTYDPAVRNRSLELLADVWF